MKLKQLKSNVQRELNKARLVMMAVAASATLPITAIASPSPVVTYRAAPEGFPGAVLVTADADGSPHFDCVGEAAPGRRMEPDTVFWMASNTKGVLAAHLQAVGHDRLHVRPQRLAERAPCRVLQVVG